MTMNQTPTSGQRVELENGAYMIYRPEVGAWAVYTPKAHPVTGEPIPGQFDISWRSAAGEEGAATNTTTRVGPDGKEHRYQFNRQTGTYDIDLGLASEAASTTRTNAQAQLQARLLGAKGSTPIDRPVPTSGGPGAPAGMQTPGGLPVIPEQDWGDMFTFASIPGRLLAEGQGKPLFGNDPVSGKPYDVPVFSGGIPGNEQGIVPSLMVDQTFSPQIPNFQGTTGTGTAVGFGFQPQGFNAAAGFKPSGNAQKDYERGLSIMQAIHSGDPRLLTAGNNPEQRAKVLRAIATDLNPGIGWPEELDSEGFGMAGFARGGSVESPRRPAGGRFSMPEPQVTQQAGSARKGMVTPEPITGMGQLTGRPYFQVGEAGPEFLSNQGGQMQIDPMMQNMMRDYMPSPATNPVFWPGMQPSNGRFGFARGGSVEAQDEELSPGAALARMRAALRRNDGSAAIGEEFPNLPYTPGAWMASTEGGGWSKAYNPFSDLAGLSAGELTMSLPDYASGNSRGGSIAGAGNIVGLGLDRTPAAQVWLPTGQLQRLSSPQVFGYNPYFPGAQNSVTSPFGFAEGGMAGYAPGEFEQQAEDETRRQLQLAQEKMLTDQQSEFNQMEAARQNVGDILNVARRQRGRDVNAYKFGLAGLPRPLEANVPNDTATPPGVEPALKTLYEIQSEQAQVAQQKRAMDLKAYQLMLSRILAQQSGINLGANPGIEEFQGFAGGGTIDINRGVSLDPIEQPGYQPPNPQPGLPGSPDYRSGYTPPSLFRNQMNQVRMMERRPMRFAAPPMR